MGKGYNNYMCKKFFHPSSRDNLKRVWMVEQKNEAEEKKQEELRVQYEKEQDLYNNKALLTKGENREKLSLNFMYEPPAGIKRQEEVGAEAQPKFEWQRKFNAPRESYCKGDETIKDQPFGIAVRNVRCLKCKKWGHINTDKECSLFGIVIETEEKNEKVNEEKLKEGLMAGGLRLKNSNSIGIFGNPSPHADNQRFLPENEDEMDILKSLDIKQKKRLLRRLERLNKKEDRKERAKKKKNKKNKRKRSSSSSSESETLIKKHKKSKKKRGKSFSPDVKSRKTKSEKNKKSFKKSTELIDTEALLKEITKGLNVEFAGPANPFDGGMEPPRASSRTKNSNSTRHRSPSVNKYIKSPEKLDKYVANTKLGSRSPSRKVEHRHRSPAYSRRSRSRESSSRNSNKINHLLKEMRGRF